MAVNDVDSLNVGDRVYRAGDDTRRGKVTKVYSGVPDGRGNTITHYEVHWDTLGHPVGGYLRIGLVKIEPSKPLE